MVGLLSDSIELLPTAYRGSYKQVAAISDERVISLRTVPLYLSSEPSFYYCIVVRCFELHFRFNSFKDHLRTKHGFASGSVQMMYRKTMANGDEC